MVTRRSAIVQYQRCPRSRYWAYQHSGTGLEPIRQSIPLATGTAAHLGLAFLLQGSTPIHAITSTLSWYDESCERRGLKLDELEDYSFVYRQQRALIEGLIWLAHYRILPKLTSLYETLEIERQGVIPNFADGVDLAYRPDALLRSREDGDLYILSWKTASQVGKWTEDDARVDMQGVSEMWARSHDAPSLGEIRGVQMVFLLKGRKVPMDTDDTGESKQKRIDSPLIWGYQDHSFPPQMAASRYYHCAGPHPMRKSKWYPTGQCNTLGKIHRRGDNWEPFPTWETLGTAEWIRRLADHEVAADEGDVLDRQWTMPIPFYRTSSQTQSWFRQARAQEEKIAALDCFPQMSPDFRLKVLDELYPQYTHNCNHIYGGTCPYYELCWGPPQSAESPLDNGFQPHEQYADLALAEAE